MASFKNHIGRFALPTVLILGISSGIWAFLELAGARDTNGHGYSGSGNHSRMGIDGSSDLLQDGRVYIRPVLGLDRDDAGSAPVFAGTNLNARNFAGDSTRQPADTLKQAQARAPDTSGARRDSAAEGSGRTAIHDTLFHNSVLDTLSGKSDTISLDSLKLSAWLAEIRKDNPQAQPFPEYHYPLFLYTNIVQNSQTIDSTGKFVDIRETVFGSDIRTPIDIPLDEYIKMEENYFARKNWEDLAHAYTSKLQSDQLGALMQGMTNIDIPIPSNPVLSIFGPPRINLKISGAVDIHGAWQNQKTDVQTLSALGNVTNQPDFKQDVQINVDGTVGDKLSIGANWDTQNQFDYENQLHIKYSGYDDEIVKSVEAGNVSMSTNSSFIGSSQALFGIKSQMQFGPLTLTALASQQKAQGKTLTVSGGSQSQTFTLHAYDYSQNHYFIDTTYIYGTKPGYGYENYYTKAGRPYDPSLYVNEFEVWVSVPTQQPGNTQLRDGVAIADLPAIQEANPGFVASIRDPKKQLPTQSGTEEEWKFQLLPTSQYSLNQQTGVLTLLSSLQAGQALGIAYTRGTNAEQIGTLSYKDTSKTTQRLVLELVKPAYPQPSYVDTWRQQLRNIYPVGGLNLAQSSLQHVQILYTPSGQTAQDNINGVKLLQLFGVDKTSPDGSGGPDGVFDVNNGIDVDLTNGEIIFPFLKPFEEAFQQPGALAIPGGDTLAFDAVYDTTSDAAQQDAIHDKFTITGSFTSAIQSHYTLGFNLVQGSVKVLLNGNPLTPDVDYTVDYVTGDVNIKNQSALQPGANVQIQYETNDIFQIASKSLVGLRGDVKFSDQTGMGFTLMNFNQQSPNDKVRLGEEPMSNTIMGADFTTAQDLPFLTRAIDALPLIQTAAPSKITVHAEGAYMLPNPNTRTSVIPDDNGQGIAYIDDFEGAKRTINLPVTYSNWSLASPPDSCALDSLYPGIDYYEKNDFRGWTYWYNVTPSNILVKTIWPGKQVPADQQFQTVLSIVYEDSVRGQYNRSHNLDTTLRKDPSADWGGLMTLLSGTATNLATQNVNYIEVWMRIENAPGNGKMYIDLGQLSEDVIGDHVLHTEDTTGNGTLQNGLDLGPDLWNDQVEQDSLPWITDRKGLFTADGKPTLDPDGDDYYFNLGNGSEASTDYTQVNGTEGNSITSEGKFPDTEDLNHNGQLDQTNNYFRYAIKLDTLKNPFINGGGSNGWYQYIIPLRDYEKAVGNPSLDLVQYVRIWFSGVTGYTKVRIAQMDFVGNYWRTPDQSDTTLQASVVSVEDNPATYTPPAPGLQPVDHSDPTQNVLLNEQSLDLILNGLHDGDSRYVFKTMPQSLDLFNYHTMKVFVHGDPKFNYVSESNYDAEVYLRFGSDSLNFYEYRQPIQKGWKDISIDFASLTAIKQSRDSATATIEPRQANNGNPGATYWLQGNPSLQNVTYFQIGVTNPRNKGTPYPLFGEVWIDELRLTNVDNTPGGAYLFNSSLLLADVGSLTFNFSKTDPYFHQLTTQFGSRNTTRNWSLSGAFSFDRLLPKEWVGTSIPFTYTHSENFSNPLYLPNSDIPVAAAVSNRETYLIKQKGYTDAEAAAAADSLLVSSQVMTVGDQWSIPSMRIAVPSSKWYIRDLINGITTGFNWNGSTYRDPQRKSGKSWAWNFNGGYSAQFDPLAYFTPFPSTGKGTAGTSQDFQIRYLPNQMSFTMSASRSLTTETYWIPTAPRISPSFTAQRSGAISWKLTNNGLLNPTIDYRFNVGSSLQYIDVDTSHGNTPYPDSYVFHQIFLNHGLINFGQDNSFSESFNLTTQPKVPFKLDRFFDLQSGYSSQYQWSYAQQQAQFGRGAGYSSSLQLGSTIRLKSLTDPWFNASVTSAANAPGEQQALPQPPPTGRRGHGREEFETIDTTSTSSSGGTGGGGLAAILRTAIKIPFLDFDNIAINFTSSNSEQDGGLPSIRPGMGNFFRLPFLQESDPSLGPSQLYQLGLISDPYGRPSFIGKKGFPFFAIETSPSLRIGNANIADNFSNSNSLDMRTSRDLWKGARIDLSWHLSWNYTRNTTFQTDSLGNVIKSSMSTMTSGQITRSFFSIPPVLFFSFFKSGIGQVSNIYQTLVNDPTDARTNDQKLAQAFEQGFETLPVLDKIFGQYMPRLNYSFHWDGLEQLPLFKSFATHVSLDHSYQSTFSQNWNSTTSGQIVTQGENLTYGFQPLLGLNISFMNWGDATISGSVMYNTSSQFQLSPSSSTPISQSNTGQLTISADYAKRGFSLPLFGLNLQNDIDISASYSSSLTNSISYTTDNLSTGGQPINGTRTTTIEIRFKYAISQRVTASIFYQNTKTAPTVSASPIPGTTTNEAGVDVHVSIAG